MDIIQKSSFTYQSFYFQFSPIILHLKKDFRTAHTSTNSRTNFLIKIRYENHEGLGEAGLPPKKPKCYLADIKDCMQFMFELKQLLSKSNLTFNDILNIPNYFQIFKNSNHKKKFTHLLSTANTLKQPRFRAGKSACQFAIFDLWSRLEGKSLNKCLYNEQRQHNFRSFYTVSLSENIQDMVEQAKYSLKHSNLLKIKLDNRIHLIKSVLQKFSLQNLGEKWVIDANASWSIQTALQFLKYIKQLKIQKKIYYLQQPFPIDADLNEWKEVKKSYQKEGVKILADQSFSILEDLEKLKDIVDGVNIKIQKVGGLIDSIKLIIQSKKINKDIWIGSMISSQLGCTQAFQLNYFAQYGDLDGGLLTISPFKGGFQWAQNGSLINIQGAGLSVSPI